MVVNASGGQWLLISVVVSGCGCKWLSITIVTLDMVCPFMNVISFIHICPVTSYGENCQVFFRKKFKHIFNDRKETILLKFL